MRKHKNDEIHYCYTKGRKYDVTVKVHLEGFILQGGLTQAKHALRKYNNCYLLLYADNGVDLFIKENGAVRVSTMAEYLEYSK